MKNLIIICPDEMRADCAGFMGDPLIRTPHMDRLAQRGVVFEKHMTTFPKCVPTRCSLVTGRFCNTDGWRSVSQTLEKGQPELMTALKGLGYQTAVFGKNHCWHEDDWNALDFGSHAAPMDRFMEGRQAITETAPDPDGAKPLDLDSGWDYIGSHTRHMRDEAYAEQSIEFLTKARDKSRPFFLQINIESPHPKYGVEEPYFSMYDRAQLPPWPHDLPRNAPLPVLAQREHRTGLAPQPEAAREVQAVYYGMISKVDHLVGQILNAVDSEGLWENSVILFLSDHGDYAGQYGLPEKWDTHFPDCLMQVPCILCDPQLKPGRVSSLTSTVDLAPTLCQLLDIEPLPDMHGESLLPVVQGDIRRKAVFANGGHESEMRQRYGEVRHRHPPRPERYGKGVTYEECPDSMARAKMARTDRYKLVVREVGGNELYDLESDPWEMDNRWGDPALASVLPELLLLLVEWSLQTDPTKPRLDYFTV